MVDTYYKITYSFIFFSTKRHPLLNKSKICVDIHGHSWVYEGTKKILGRYTIHIYTGIRFFIKTYLESNHCLILYSNKKSSQTVRKLNIRHTYNLHIHPHIHIHQYAYTNTLSGIRRVLLSSVFLEI